MIPALFFTGLAVPWILWRNKTHGVYFLDIRAGYKGEGMRVPKLTTMTPNDYGDLEITSFGRFARHIRIDEWPQLWLIIKRKLSWYGPRPTQFEDSNAAYLEQVLGRMLPGLLSWNNLRRLVERELFERVVEPIAERIVYDLSDARHSTVLDRTAVLVATSVTWVALLWSRCSPVFKEEPLEAIYHSVAWLQNRRQPLRPHIQQFGVAASA